MKVYSVDLQHKDEEPIVWFVVTLYLSKKPSGSFEIVRDRAHGFFFTEEEAYDCIIKNLGDIYECSYYNHSLIQPMQPGLYNSLHEKNRWFVVQHNETEDAHPEDGMYTVTELSVPPKGLENICGFCVG